MFRFLKQKICKWCCSEEDALLEEYLDDPNAQSSELVSSTQTNFELHEQESYQLKPHQIPTHLLENDTVHEEDEALRLKPEQTPLHLLTSETKTSQNINENSSEQTVLSLYDGKYDPLFEAPSIPISGAVIQPHIWDALLEKLPAQYSIPHPSSQKLYQ